MSRGSQPSLPANHSFVLASRGSTLALWQANYVADLLRKHGHSIDIKTWKTTGDIVQDRFLHEIGGKGLFIKELEEAMAQGAAHLAVHSLKDMPAKIPVGFSLAAVLKRHESADVVIFRSGVWKKLGLAPRSMLTADTLKSLGPLTLATSSLRRQAILKSDCPNITTVPIRGNVDTRLKKLEAEENWHGIILAEASLERLAITNVHAHRLDPTWFIPCAGQGALAIETKQGSDAERSAAKLECTETRLAVDVERAVLARLGGDCTMPFGCLVTKDPVTSDHLIARAIVLSNDGRSAKSLCRARKDSPGLAKILEDALINELRKNGANDVLQNLGIEVRI